jgi:hypothetical protein
MVGSGGFRLRSLICESDGRDTLAAPYGLRVREHEWLVVWFLGLVWVAWLCLDLLGFGLFGALVDVSF